MSIIPRLIIEVTRKSNHFLNIKVKIRYNNDKTFKEKYWRKLHCKKSLAIFPSPAGMSLANLSMAGNNLTIPGQDEFG